MGRLSWSVQRCRRGEKGEVSSKKEGKGEKLAKEMASAGRGGKKEKTERGTHSKLEKKGKKRPTIRRRQSSAKRRRGFREGKRGGRGGIYWRRRFFLRRVNGKGFLVGFVLGLTGKGAKEMSH